MTKLTEAEYLAIERAAETKSEFLDGEMFAMSGASLRHNVITGNILASLWNALRGKGCTTFSGDLRVRVASSGSYVYPDVGVFCGQPEMVDETFDTLTNPVLLVEVLSKSTANYDQGEKSRLYRTLESLQELLFVDQASLYVAHYQRQDDGSWRFTETRAPAERIKLESLGVDLDLAVVYEGVELDDGSRRVPSGPVGPAPT